jgi:hypothetical protein
MTRTSLLALLLGLGLGWSPTGLTAAEPAPTSSSAPTIDFNHLPWTDGEALTYLVSWSGLEAAQGVFVAHDKGDHWEFNLALASRGHRGNREIWVEGKTKHFPIAEDSVDDVGTMLYHLRAGAWKPGDHRLLHVYESNSEKEALAECQARETRAFGIWPSQPLLRIFVLPGKGTHHRGSLMLWMTDDARHLPVHADLDFRYGSFSIDLTQASPK